MPNKEKYQELKNKYDTIAIRVNVMNLPHFHVTAFVDKNGNLANEEKNFLLLDIMEFFKAEEINKIGDVIKNFILKIGAEEFIKLLHRGLEAFDIKSDWWLHFKFNIENKFVKGLKNFLNKTKRRKYVS